MRLACTGRQFCQVLEHLAYSCFVGSAYALKATPADV